MMFVVLDNRSFVRVCVDANALIDYARECALHDLGMAPTGRRADALRRRLDRTPRVFTAATAGMEAQRNISKDIANKLGYQKAGRVIRYAQKVLYNYLKSRKRKDELEHVSAIRSMYGVITGNPTGPKFILWMNKKSEYIHDPVLGTDTNDLKILSTAIYYVQLYPVEFWTHEMDFTMFADEIYETFGLRVVDTCRLGQFL